LTVSKRSHWRINLLVGDRLFGNQSRMGRNACYTRKSHIPL